MITIGEESEQDVGDERIEGIEGVWDFGSVSRLMASLYPVLAAFLMAVAISFIFRKRRGGLPLPPGPMGLPVVSLFNIPMPLLLSKDFITSRSHYWENLSRDEGNTCIMRLKNFIFVPHGVIKGNICVKGKLPAAFVTYIGKWWESLNWKCLTMNCIFDAWKDV